MKLAIVTTHPIQYYAPIFKLLHERGNIEVKVFYTWGEAASNKYDPGFGKIVTWDIPLTEGYYYQWVQNTSADPGSHHFKGIVNPDLINKIELWQPSAVLFFGWAYSGHLKAIRYFKNKIPVFFRGDSTLLDVSTGAKTFLKSFFLKWLYKNIDHAFYVGASNKAYFEKYGLNERRLSFAPHAIDNDRFALDKITEAAAVRQDLGIPDHATFILFAGKLEDKKSPSLLLEAVLALNKPDVHLAFLGNGKLETELKLRAENINNIHFCDFKNQSAMPAAYQACDLFCLPSKGPGETWGLAVNEAMASGKAILVSDRVGCATDLVKNDYNGLIFQSGNIEELVDCLSKLTRSKNLLKKYGENSKELIKDWNFMKIAEAIEQKLVEK